MDLIVATLGLQLNRYNKKLNNWIKDWEKAFTMSKIIKNLIFQVTSVINKKNNGSLIEK